MKNKTEVAIKQVGHIIDLWMPLKIKYDKTPGISIAIAHKGKVIYAKGFGFADLAHKDKADKNTPYHIASHSKMFTAVAIMKLVEDGKIRLDDHVVDYLPWFKAKTKHSDSANITIRQILSHTSGIFRDGDTPQWVTGKFPKDLQKSFSPKSLVIENSTTFKYTNYGYSLLGLVIQKASGLKYEDYVTKHIIKPLGMNNTYPDYSDGIKNIATGYSADVPDTKRIAFGHYVTNAYAPATGFVSNAIDMIKFISSLSLDSDSKKVLTRESIKEMARPHAKTGDKDEYGLGLDIGYFGNRKTIGHGGGFSGFVTRTILDTKDDVSVAVFSNSLGSSASEIAEGILDSISRFVNNQMEYSSNIKFSHSKYEGIYRNVWGDSVVSKIGNILIDFSPMASNPLRASARLVPTPKSNIFVIKSKNVFGSYDEEVVFSDFKNGKASKLKVGSTPQKRVSL